MYTCTLVHISGPSEGSIPLLEMNILTKALHGKVIFEGDL